MTNIDVQHYGAVEQISSVIPWLTVPEKTQGVEKLVAEIAASDAGNCIAINFESLATSVTGTAGPMAALFIDDEQFARRVWFANPFQPSFFVSIGGSFEFFPGDTNSHKIRIRLGAAAGTVCFNGSAAGQICGGVSAAKLTAREVK